MARDEDPARQRAIDEIAAKARATRPKSSRAMKLAAAAIAVASAIVGLVILFAEAEPERATPTRVSDPAVGFSTGVVVGLAVGIAIGFAIARQMRKPE